MTADLYSLPLEVVVAFVPADPPWTLPKGRRRALVCWSVHTNCAEHPFLRGWLNSLKPVETPHLACYNEYTLLSRA